MREHFRSKGDQRAQSNLIYTVSFLSLVTENQITLPPLILSSEAKKNPRTASSTRIFLMLMPDNDLLSHGETPHYHRR